MKMNINYGHNPNDIKNYSTSELRSQFLVEKIFEPGKINLTYTYNDRMILGGVMPTDKPLEIVLNKDLGVDYFLQRRELGIINLGGEGTIEIDGKKEQMTKHDGFYIGKGNKHVRFISSNVKDAAKYYVVSTPAQKSYPNKKLLFKNALRKSLGDQEHMNKRTIYKYIDASQMKTCQLQMGYTVLNNGSGWNTMPAHTHARRMEAYLYCEFASPDTRVFHILGKPDETKELLVRNEQAVINPSWSIHCGVGTTNYAFIWAMAGENQTYDDMDMISMEDLN